MSVQNDTEALTEFRDEVQWVMRMIVLRRCSVFDETPANLLREFREGLSHVQDPEFQVWTRSMLLPAYWNRLCQRLKKAGLIQERGRAWLGGKWSPIYRITETGREHLSNAHQRITAFVLGA